MMIDNVAIVILGAWLAIVALYWLQAWFMIPPLFRYGIPIATYRYDFSEVLDHKIESEPTTVGLLRHVLIRRIGFDDFGMSRFVQVGKFRFGSTTVVGHLRELAPNKFEIKVRVSWALVLAPAVFFALLFLGNIFLASIPLVFLWLLLMGAYLSEKSRMIRISWAKVKRRRNRRNGKTSQKKTSVSIKNNDLIALLFEYYGLPENQRRTVFNRLEVFKEIGDTLGMRE